MKTTIATSTPIIITAANRLFTVVEAFLTNLLNRELMSSGIRDTMLYNRMIEIPFPTPCSVICSPSHIKRAEPAVMDTIQTVMDVNVAPPVRRPWLAKPIAIAALSIRESTIVTYLVYSEIFFLPSSPSLCSSSRRGIAIVSSCKIMEDVIYGVMFSAKIDIFSKEPPVN